MKTTSLCGCTAAILLALFCSFTTSVFKKDTKGYTEENDLVEITSLIQTTVMLYDSTKFLKEVKQANSSNDYIEQYRTQFLTYPAFNALKMQLEKTYNDAKSLIYFDAESAAASTLRERKDQKEKFFKKVNTLTFYETWYYNKQTGEIVKKQLGYAVGQWDNEKDAFREWYLHFTAQEARLVYLKNW